MGNTLRDLLLACDTGQDVEVLGDYLEEIGEDDLKEWCVSLFANSGAHLLRAVADPEHPSHGLWLTLAAMGPIAFEGKAPPKEEYETQLHRLLEMLDIEINPEQPTPINMEQDDG